MSIEQTIAREAESYPELHDLHAGDRADIIDLAIDRLRRRRTYWVVSLAALAPGVLLIILMTRQSIQVRHGHWLGWFAGAYGVLVVLGYLPLCRWIFRKSMHEVMRLRPSDPTGAAFAGHGAAEAVAVAGDPAVDGVAEGAHGRNAEEGSERAEERDGRRE